MKKFALLFLIGTTLVLAACSGLSASSAAQEIAIEAEALTYNPATIEVTAGKPVKLTFHNKDAVDHDFSIMEIPMVMSATAEPMAGHDMGGLSDQPQLHMAVAMGGIGSMEFTPSKPGTYEFLCTVPGHKEAGMKGTLVVKAP
jgi:uncharacterized cupredoxin-like copper-binding protein